MNVTLKVGRKQLPLLGFCTAGMLTEQTDDTRQDAGSFPLIAKTERRVGKSSKGLALLGGQSESSFFVLLQKRAFCFPVSLLPALSAFGPHDHSSAFEPQVLGAGGDDGISNHAQYQLQLWLVLWLPLHRQNGTVASPRLRRQAVRSIRLERHSSKVHVELTTLHAPSLSVLVPLQTQITCHCGHDKPFTWFQGHLSVGASHVPPHRFSHIHIGLHDGVEKGLSSNATFWASATRTASKTDSTPKTDGIRTPHDRGINEDGFPSLVVEGQIDRTASLGLCDTAHGDGDCDRPGKREGQSQTTTLGQSKRSITHREALLGIAVHQNVQGVALERRRVCFRMQRLAQRHQVGKESNGLIALTLGVDGALGHDVRFATVLFVTSLGIVALLVVVSSLVTAPRSYGGLGKHRKGLGQPTGKSL